MELILKKQWPIKYILYFHQTGYSILDLITGSVIFMKKVSIFSLLASETLTISVSLISGAGRVCGRDWALTDSHLVGVRLQCVGVLWCCAWRPRSEITQTEMLKSLDAKMKEMDTFFIKLKLRANKFSKNSQFHENIVLIQLAATFLIII